VDGDRGSGASQIRHGCRRSVVSAHDLVMAMPLRAPISA
jgi:hypothetical protein